MYDKLFEVLQMNYNLTVTPKMLTDMGLKRVEDTDTWYVDNLQSIYSNITVDYTETILETVHKIIQEDANCAQYERIDYHCDH